MNKTSRKYLHVFCLIIEVSILFGVIGYGIYNAGIKSHTDTIDWPSEFRVKFSEGQDELLKKFVSFSVFYSTAEKPNRWTSPLQRFTMSLDGCVTDREYRHELLPGVQGVRLEFNPKKDFLGVHTMPKLSYLKINDRMVRVEEISEYYEDRVGKPSYNVELTEYLKGWAGWLCIGATVFAMFCGGVTICCVFFKVHSAEFQDGFVLAEVSGDAV